MARNYFPAILPTEEVMGPQLLFALKRGEGKRSTNHGISTGTGPTLGSPGPQLGEPDGKNVLAHLSCGLRQDERGQRDAPAGYWLRNRSGGTACRAIGGACLRVGRLRSRTRHCARARPSWRLSLWRHGSVTVCGCLV